MASHSHKPVTEETIDEVIALSRLLGEFGQIKRVTKLPNGEYEPDSHHSFALALTGFELAGQFAPELDRHKIILYALVHDLPELITGDVATLVVTPDQLKQKAKQDELALTEIAGRLRSYPHILAALRSFEAGQDAEALFVYWLDNIMTIPTNFYEKGDNLRALGVRNRTDIKGWYERVSAKLAARPGEPHHSAVQIMELAYRKMHDELLEDA